MSEPFDVIREIPVPGGALHVAQSGPAPDEADAVVLAVHGVTSSLMAFARLARELRVAVPGACLLVPDLRGRGCSASMPGPYGVVAHLADLVAVLDGAGVERAVLTGHSMGAYIAARLAAERPERTSALVMLDGGVSLPVPPDQTAEEVLEEVVEQSAARLRMTFSSVDEYVGLWHEHPALLGEWNDDIEAYARYEVSGPSGHVGCIVSEEAVVADCTDLVLDGTTAGAAELVRAPMHLVRAPRGLFDDDDPLLPQPLVDAFSARHPDARIEDVDGVNHYTLILGSGPGPARTARVIRRAMRHAVAA
jgi:pimeloyl-ACP methyl ester carboxylesterase